MAQRWSTRGLRRAIKDRFKQLLGEGEEHLYKLLSTPYPGEPAGPAHFGEPPYRRTGDLRDSIRTKVWPVPTNRLIGRLDVVARSETSGLYYGRILEGPEQFMAFGKTPLGPYPFMLPTMKWLRRRARKVLGKPFTRAEWGFTQSADFTQVRKVVL